MSGSGTHTSGSGTHASGSGTHASVAPDPRAALQADAESRGFIVAWAPVTLPAHSRERYEAWIAGGHHATMGQLARAVAVRQDPPLRLAWARSAMVLAAQHAAPDPGLPAGGLRIGRVARIFWLREQEYVRRLVEPHLEELKQRCYDLGGRSSDYVDQGPLPLRSYATLAGLGWIGRNGMLMNRLQGSHLTLAVLLTSFEPPPTHATPGHCGTCTRCVTGCPTGALSGDGWLDARRCTSYWTTQHRDVIPLGRWDGIGDWLMGCDICQEVCPWNRDVAGLWSGYEVEAELAHPDLTDFLLLPDAEFARRYAGSSFERAGRARIARNALIVLANAGDPAHIKLVRRAAGDLSPLVRATAAQALVKLGDLARAARLREDPSALVARAAHEAIATAA